MGAAFKYGDFKLMSPKVDFAFKELMRNDKVRKGFLSAVLDIPVSQIKKTVLKNTELPRLHDDEKQGILDVRMIMNDNTEINIEIQVSAMKTWSNRSVFYVAKMLTEQVDINQKYSNIKKCIGINILDFRCIEGTERFHTTFHVNEDTEHLRFTDVLEWHIVELPKLPQTDDGTDLYQWARFISAEREEEFAMWAEKNEYIGEALNRLEVISQDEKMRMAYTARQKAIFDYNTQMEERFEDGIAKGRAEERRNLIEMMRAKGYSEHDINDLLN